MMFSSMMLGRQCQATLTQFPQRFVRRQLRINRAAQKSRNERVTKESSFNKNEVLQAFYSKKPSGMKMEGGAIGNLDALFDTKTKQFQGSEVFERVKEVSQERKFQESVEVIVKLNVDPTQGDQNVRGTCVLPAGTGQDIKVCVFAGEEFHEEIKASGADFIGNDAILKDIGEGVIPFDKIIATPEHMPTLKALARVLGPKGLMPNVKSGTLVKQHELVETVKISKQGLIEFRVNEGAFIMNKIGHRGFENDALLENLNALMAAIAKRKPESVKGKYFAKAQVKTSMGPPLKIDVNPYQALIQTQQ